jgi:hypothetical protein
MQNHTTTEKFIRLFRGRGDVYGHDEGRCVKARITDEHWADHLNGVSGMGVYPAVPTPDGVKCVWGCTDIDVEDHGSALLLQNTLAVAGITSWVERSRSKGYHVWIFSQRPVSAEAMRNMQLVAHDVAGMRPIEVNPKQTDVSLNKVGNYVRLPYMGGLVETPARRVIIDSAGEPVPLAVFVDDAMQTANDPADIQRIASMYQPPATTTVVFEPDESSASIAECLRPLSGLGYVIWRDGPAFGRDRSNTLLRLTYICQECGLSPSAARQIVADADRRWGKFYARPDGEQELDKIVVRVYQ